MRLLTSQLRGPGPLVVAPSMDAERRAQAEAKAPVMWARYDPVTRSTRFVPIDPARIPPGWQSVQFHVPMRLASCEEVDCPMFLGGWTEVTPTGSQMQPVAGAMSQDRAAATFGLYGPREVPPEVVWHEPGTPCPRIHKVPSGVPPAYTINGRFVPWTQFEDAIGNGLEAARTL